MVSFGSGGRIASQGSLSSVLANDKQLSSEVVEQNEIIEKAEHDIDHQEVIEKQPKAAPDGKLIVDEEVAIGHVSWSASGS